MGLNYSLSSPDFPITGAMTNAAEEVVSKLHSRHPVQRTEIGLSKTPKGFNVSATVKLEQGAPVHCEEENHDLYIALNSAKAKLLRLLGDQREKALDFQHTPAREAISADEV